LGNKLAFVLGGGGARGALQVGALQALLEAGIQPDLLVGTSVGAVNAAFLAMHGFNAHTIAELAVAWKEASAVELMPSNYVWLTVRAVFKRPDRQTVNRMRDFYISHGLSPTFRFRDVRGPRLILVAADLNAGQPVLFGTDLQETVMEGLLASTALPPWISPIRRDGQMLIDGGLVSTLPIEPALRLGADEIIALDLADARLAQQEALGFGPFINKMIITVEKRQMHLELALAAAREVPVLHIPLNTEAFVPVWDFSFCDDLIDRGYAVTRQALVNWRQERRSGWRNLYTGLLGRFKRPRLGPNR
jgi:NTE family protein